MAKSAIPLIVLLLIVTAGCVRTEPGRGGEVGFYGTMNATESGFVMDGQITLGGGIPKQDEFENVTVYLFTENGTLIRSHRAGTLTGLLNVSLTTSRTPHYVVINSPDFWEEPRFSVRYYQFMEEKGPREYGIHYAYSRQDLPVEIPPATTSPR